MSSILQDTHDRTCYVCAIMEDKTEYAYREEHHIFHGSANRKKSEEYGLKVKLCQPHHRDSEIGVHFNPDLDTLLKQTAQKKFEETHAREDFIAIFGKSVLP